MKLVLQQIRLLQVAWILTSDWIKLRGNHAIHGSYVTCRKQVCLGPVKRAKCTDFVAKSRTTLYFLQQILATCSNLICCKAGLNEASKTSNIAIQIVFKQCWKTKYTFLLPVLPYHKTRKMYRLCLKKSNCSLLSATTFRSFQRPDLLKGGRLLNVGGKTRKIAIQLVLQQCWKTSCTFLLPVLSKLK